jgi:hypothetical protein
VGFGATPQGLKTAAKRFLEVWNLFAIEKGSKNLKIDFCDKDFFTFSAKNKKGEYQ